MRDNLECEICQEEATWNYKVNEHRSIKLCTVCKEIWQDEHMYEISIGKRYFEPISKGYTKERK